MRIFTAFILGAMFFTACGTATVPFPYKFFHVSPIEVWDHDEGKLKGADPKFDHDLKDCKPTRLNEKGQLIQECVVVFYEELNDLVDDYKTTKQQLIDCQKGKK
jgi:hypothetical protein